MQKENDEFCILNNGCAAWCEKKENSGHAGFRQMEIQIVVCFYYQTGVIANRLARGRERTGLKAHAVNE